MRNKEKIYEKYIKEYYENYKNSTLDGWKVYGDKNLDKNIYTIDNDKYNDYTEGTWYKKEIFGNPEDLKRLMDMVEKQREDTTVLGTLKIRENKLILEHRMKEIILCDLDDDSAAATIMAAIAKIQLEEMSNNGK